MLKFSVFLIPVIVLFQRSYPISYYSQKSTSPLITDNNKPAYSESNGSIYVIAGMGGKSIYSLNGKLPSIVNRLEGYGILDVKITNGRSKLGGTFYSNNGNEILETFSIVK
jgi:hypothetical protein